MMLFILIGSFISFFLELFNYFLFIPNQFSNLFLIFFVVFFIINLFFGLGFNNINLDILYNFFYFLIKTPNFLITFLINILKKKRLL